MRACEKPSVPPLRGQQLAALRALGGEPGGLRLDAYRQTMPLLEAMGLVEQRARRGRPAPMVWRLTRKGSRALDVYGRDDG